MNQTSNIHFFAVKKKSDILRLISHCVYNICEETINLKE